VLATRREGPLLTACGSRRAWISARSLRAPSSRPGSKARRACGRRPAGAACAT
jgi:hypothetical protein